MLGGVNYSRACIVVTSTYRGSQLKKKIVLVHVALAYLTGQRYPTQTIQTALHKGRNIVSGEVNSVNRTGVCK